MIMFYVFLAALAVIVVAAIYFSFALSKKEDVIVQEFNDLYVDSLAKELEAQKKFEAECYSNINDVVEFENVEVPVYPIVEKKVAKKKAAKKKSAKKKTSKKRTANKVVKDEEV